MQENDQIVGHNNIKNIFIKIITQIIASFGMEVSSTTNLGMASVMIIFSVQKHETSLILCMLTERTIILQLQEKSHLQALCKYLGQFKF